MSSASSIDWGPRHRRRRRGRVLAFLVALVAVAGIGIGGWYLLHSGSPAKPCVAAPSGPASPVSLRPADVHLEVLNGTSRAGLARDTGSQLQLRGFRVDNVGNAASPFVGVAQVRYGAAARAAAVLVAAQLPSAVLVPDGSLVGRVGLVLGSAYLRLRTPAEVRAALSKAPVVRTSGSPTASASPTCRPT